MDYQERNIINELTEAVIEHYGIQIPVQNMVEVVSRIGGRISFGNRISTLGDGCIRKEGDSFVIMIDPSQPENRINFTIAHELGHLFLHMGYAIDRNLWQSQDTDPYYRYGNTAMEYEANEFAAALLMPKREYKNIIDMYTTGDIVDTAKVAEYFNVSVGAAANRGKWLGYLEW